MSDPPALPAPDDLPPNDIQILNVNSTITLDDLGPMVVNTDGTLSRIANWQSMTQSERERTLRVLSARNRLRFDKLEKNQRRPTGDSQDLI